MNRNRGCFSIGRNSLARVFENLGIGVPNSRATPFRRFVHARRRFGKRNSAIDSAQLFSRNRELTNALSRTKARCSIVAKSTPNDLFTPSHLISLRLAFIRISLYASAEIRVNSAAESFNVTLLPFLFPLRNTCINH